MKDYYELEDIVLSCILLKPELIKKDINEKYFVKNKRMYKFMKTFYERYQCFDIPLMYNVCRDKVRIYYNIEKLVLVECNIDCFDKYCELLKQKYNIKKEERVIINTISDLTDKLLVGSITLQEFVKNINLIIK